MEGNVRKKIVRKMVVQVNRFAVQACRNCCSWTGAIFLKCMSLQWLIQDVHCAHESPAYRESLAYLNSLKETYM